MPLRIKLEHEEMVTLVACHIVIMMYTTALTSNSTMTTTPSKSTGISYVYGV
jgi:hypothetical protein